MLFAQIVLQDLQQFVAEALKPVAGINNLLLKFTLTSIEMISQIGGDVGGECLRFLFDRLQLLGDLLHKLVVSVRSLLLNYPSCGFQQLRGLGPSFVLDSWGQVLPQALLELLLELGGNLRQRHFKSAASCLSAGQLFANV